MAPSETVPHEFLCAATGKLLYLPVVTLSGAAYNYVALFEMFMKADGLPRCKVSGEPISFFPSVCLPLHHFLMAEYRPLMKSRRQHDENDMHKFGLALPVVTEAPEDPTDDGFLEEFQCVVSRQLAVEPCCLSSGTMVSAHCVPDGGFAKDPDRFVGCAMHGQAPRPSPALAAMIQAKFATEYSRLKRALVGQGSFAAGTCRNFSSDDHVHFGVGCDGCGLWPIRGEGWYDAECPDKTGFHLCDACYNYGFQRRVISGKFNQQHRPKSEMKPLQKSFLA